jgi:Mrp family chromosome partitioning ATPase
VRSRTTTKTSSSFLLHEAAHDDRRWFSPGAPGSRRRTGAARRPDHRPGSRTARVLSRALTPGLAGAIANPSLRLSAVIRRLPNSNLTILPAGACPPVPYEALRSLRAGELLAEAKASYDYVLIDAPPVVPVADVRVLTERVDGFFLVVTAHRTPRGLLDEALSTMDPEKVLGIVYNGDDLPISRRHRYYYSYGQAAPRGFLAALMGEESGR